MNFNDMKTPTITPIRVASIRLLITLLLAPALSTNSSQASPFVVTLSSVTNLRGSQRNASELQTEIQASESKSNSVDLLGAIGSIMLQLLPLF